MSLPLLPGNSFDLNIGRSKFHKCHIFDFRNRVRMEMTEDAKTPKPYSFATALVGKERDNPSWLAFDKYVLCFDAYFYEPIYTSPIENYRYRKCKVIYFLEDDTMQINEPIQKNSGILQGTIVRRQRFPKPNLNYKQGNAYYTILDLNIGETLEVFGQQYKLVDCDKFTRDFLTENGLDLHPPEPDPIDPYIQQRKEMIDHVIPKRPREKKDKLGQFLNFHPKVLRFYCVWDDTKSLYGDERKMILHYYLDDDTIEIIETRPPNSGRSDTNVLLKRSPLPKNDESLPKPGEMTDQTVLNISGVRNNEKYYALDSNALKEREITYYKDADLSLGITVNVWGRNFFLYDCDEFTKDFYLKKYEVALTPIPRPDNTPAPIPRVIYPHNIFGAAEDSIGNCFYIIPKHPRKELLKFYQYDKIGLNSRQLRFLANLITNDAINQSRLFLISYFLSDDTIQVNEPHQTNSGIMDGKHMVRMKVMKPETPKLGEPGQPIYYAPEDMFVGNIIYMRGNAYYLLNADDYTFDYMEKHCDQFIHSDIKRIMEVLKVWLVEKEGALKAQFQSIDTVDTSFVTYEEFRKIIYDNIPTKIPEHEVMTLGRFYADAENVDVKLDNLISMVQTELRKKNFSDFEKLSLTFKDYDKDKTGHFTPKELYVVIHAYPVPLSAELLRAFVYKFPKTDGDVINYEDILKAMNWQKSSTLIRAPIPSAFDLNWKGTEMQKVMERISYIPFLEDIVYGLRNTDKL